MHFSFFECAFMGAFRLPMKPMLAFPLRGRCHEVTNEVGIKLKTDKL